MKSNRDVETAKLPLEIIEHVLSFLSVPELCRIRSVCKSWNQILTRPSFHDLCDVNGRNNKDEYLFMWTEFFSRRSIARVIVNPLFSNTLSFLDVNARRWYSIPAADLQSRVCGCGHEVESRFLAMNEGLVCELTSAKGCSDKKFALAILDPVAKTRRTLPVPPQVFVYPDQSHAISSHIVTAVNDATRSYKVFLLNNLSLYRYSALRAPARVYVHDSFTDEWRALRNVPNGVDEENWATSAVVFHESLFIVKQNNSTSFSYSLSLFRYRFQEDTWAEVYQMYFPRILQHAQLVVSGNRLFLNVWLGGGRSSDPALNPRAFDDPGLKSDPDCPHPVAIFRYPNWPETDTWFEMYEVLVADCRRKPVVQLTDAQLEQIFGRDRSEIDVCHAFPCVGSNGICSSVVLVHSSSCIGFELRKYDLATGSVDALPPHPLVEPSDAKPALSKSIGDYFIAKNMKLSLRNLLAQRPKVTSTGWRLLQ